MYIILNTKLQHGQTDLILIYSLSMLPPYSINELIISSGWSGGMYEFLATGWKLDCSFYLLIISTY